MFQLHEDLVEVRLDLRRIAGHTGLFYVLPIVSLAVLGVSAAGALTVLLVGLLL